MNLELHKINAVLNTYTPFSYAKKKIKRLNQEQETIVISSNLKNYFIKQYIKMAELQIGFKESGKLFVLDKKSKSVFFIYKKSDSVYNAYTYYSPLYSNCIDIDIFIKAVEKKQFVLSKNDVVLCNLLNNYIGRELKKAV